MFVRGFDRNEECENHRHRFSIDGLVLESLRERAERAQHADQPWRASRLIDGIGIEQGYPDATDPADCGAKAQYLSFVHV